MDNLALAPLAFIAYVGWYYRSPPKGYSQLDDPVSSPARLLKLIWSTRIAALVGASLSMASAYLELRPVLLAITLSWLGIGLIARSVHSAKNVTHGSHLSMFLILLSNLLSTAWLHRNLAAPAKIAFDIKIVAVVAQITIAFLYTLVLLFWSDRMQEDDDKNVSREKGASVFSILTFAWLSDLINLGNKKVIEQSDIWSLIDGDTSEVLVARFEKIRESGGTSVPWALVKLAGPLLIYQWTCAAITSILAFAGPYFLYQIVSYISIAKGNDRYYAVWYLLGLFCSTCVKAVVDGQVFFTGRRIGTRMRAVLVALLYDKSMRRTMGTSTDEDGQASLGKVVTLMSVDTERIRSFISYSHDCLISQPISTIIALTSLFYVLGWSALAGIIMILAMGPLGTYLGKIIGRLQEQMMANTDARITIMNEVLQGIRIVKYFAWEDHFTKEVEKARTKEMNSIFHLWGAYIGFGNIGTGSGILVAFCTFATYTLVFKNTLDAATAFTAINLLRVVSDLLTYLPHQIMEIFKAKVALGRILKFFDEMELQNLRECSDDCSDSSETTLEDQIVAGFRNADFVFYGNNTQVPVVPLVTEASVPAGGKKFDEEIDALLSVDNSAIQGFQLHNLSIDFPIGKLSVIMGSTGSGKSSLLLALLGEMNCTAGRVFLPDSRFGYVNPDSGLRDSVAYVAQTAWLLNATIRDNITFGMPFDSNRYEQVIRDCSLIKDFETLDGGDLTEIGEKGINVSGGQKQRISLARACYSDARFVLLDDPLSAVDAPTARFLLHRAILGSLKGRTCILVSHAVSLALPHADYCVLVKNGEVASHGSPSEVVNDPSADPIYGMELMAEPFEEEEETSLKSAAKDGSGTTLVQAEEKANGSVRWTIYSRYFMAAGGLMFIILFGLSFFLVSFTKVANDWWLKHWTDGSQPIPTALYMNRTLPLSASSNYGSISEMKYEKIFDNLESPEIWASVRRVAANTTFSAISSLMAETPKEAAPDALFYVGMYAVFGMSMMVAANLQIIIVLYGSFVASKNLHSKLIQSVLSSPLRFFETTPIGRILNRFSKDIENVDVMVMEAVEYFVNRVINGVTIIVVIGSLVPNFLYGVLPVIFVYHYVAKRYLMASRELKRIESVTRSPIYAQFSETLTGVATIRAYGAGSRFSAVNRQNVDVNHQSFFFIWAANRWLCFRTDVLSAFVVLCSGIAVIASGVESGWAALTITYALDFTNVLLWTVRMHAEMEMAMNSVERIKEYTVLEQEAPAIIDSRRPEPNWPNRGAVEIKNLSIRYAPDQPDVLKNVTFNINAHEKVAVVGRTGAGKSTLSLAFFRIIPLSGGSITIDGIDISEIGLYDLRTRLTIIPQDPVLFTGTVRSNLDPMGEHDDSTLWDSLQRANLTESFQSQVSDTNESESTNSTVGLSFTTTLTLDFPVSENGGNFSQGQRQLLCLARALLRRTRIVFLDEATASVDNETDARIQETIRQEFVDSTVICIAHRLRTIIDYDKILVLDKGKVVEFGTPIDLIESSEIGAFRGMCEETGEYEELVQIAKSARKI